MILEKIAMTPGDVWSLTYRNSVIVREEALAYNSREHHKKRFWSTWLSANGPMIGEEYKLLDDNLELDSADKIGELVGITGRDIPRLLVSLDNMIFDITYQIGINAIETKMGIYSGSDPDGSTMFFPVTTDQIKGTEPIPKVIDPYQNELDSKFDGGTFSYGNREFVLPPDSKIYRMIRVAAVSERGAQEIRSFGKWVDFDMIQ